MFRSLIRFPVDRATSTKALVCTACALLLGACGSRDSGPLDLAFIANDESLFSSGVRLSEPAQHLRAATAQGLVSRDPQGEIVPALADRWIVTDDGLSFIFRLRSGAWPDGTPLTAQTVRRALLAAMKGVQGTSMEFDLAPIEEVRAMAGRVVELRLSGPFPTLLQLLAQPELALSPGLGSGEMTMVKQKAGALLVLRPPQERGLPEDDNWQDGTRPVRISALSAKRALASFDDGETQAVLGGRLATITLVDTGPLALGTIRLDPAIGLFGLQVTSDSDILADESLREAVAMAIDRSALITRFGIGGWMPTTRIVNPGVVDDPRYSAERWTDRSIDDLRLESRRRFAAWRATREDPTEPPLRLALSLDDGPGLDLLLAELSTQLAQIGIRLERASATEKTDLVLIDRVARYSGPRWFLNQFNCALKRGLCSEDVDYLVALAVQERDLTARATLLAEAEAELTTANVYIPLGAPLRWSLIRGNVSGFVPNRWAFHPLPPMALIAN